MNDLSNILLFFRSDSTPSRLRHNTLNNSRWKSSPNLYLNIQSQVFALNILTVLKKESSIKSIQNYFKSTNSIITLLLLCLN